MLIRFYASLDKERERVLAESLRDGAAQFGDRVEIIQTQEGSTIETGEAPEVPDEVDVACCFALKGQSRAVVEAYRAKGKRVLHFDKALIRVTRIPSGHCRVGIDSSTPVKYMMRELRNWTRWERLGIDLQPRREPSGKGGTIVWAGSSQKYYTFHRLGDATEYAVKVFDQCRATMKKKGLIYRPKPSWADYVPIPGTVISRPPETLKDALRHAHVLVTHGSSAAIDAVCHGVPAITLGECAAQFVAGHSIEGDLNNPPFPSDQARAQWCFQLAWCQWSPEELRSGEGWEFLRTELEATA